MAQFRTVTSPSSCNAVRPWWIISGLLMFLVLLSGCRASAGSVESDLSVHVWLVLAVLGVTLLAIALRRSAYKSATTGERIQWALTSAVGLYLLYRPVAAYYAMHHDLPWAVLAPLLLVLMVAGWTCRQRWVSVVAALPLLFLAAAAGIPPSARAFPVERQVENLSVTMQSVHRSGKFVECRFMLAVPPGELLRQSVDLAGVRVHSGLLGVLPQPDPGPGHMWAMEHWAGSRLYVQSRFRTPRWSRSTDVTIIAPRWPDESLVSASVEVPEPPTSAGVTSSDGVTVSVENLGVIDPQAPDVVALQVSFEYETSSEDCCEGASVRVTDENGTVLPSRSGPMKRSPGRMAGELQIQSVSADVRRISVQLFTEEQLRARQVAFRFRRMPVFRSPQAM